MKTDLVMNLIVSNSYSKHKPFGEMSDIFLSNGAQENSNLKT